MIYSLGIGKNERGIVEDCVRSRQPYPEAIRNAPVLEVGLNLFYVAFLDLMSCRTLGYSQGPISWLSIHYWCEANEIEGEQREDVFHHVARLDKAYLDWSAKKSKKELARETPPPAKAEKPRGRKR